MTWKRFRHYWPLVTGNHQPPEDSLHKGPVTLSFDDFFDINMNTLLNKQKICRWFETTCRSYIHHCNAITFSYQLYPCISQILKNRNPDCAWWRHRMETFSALLAICAGNSPVPGEFPSQRPVTRSFNVFFDMCLNKQLNKQSRGWWFETLSPSLWRHCNAMTTVANWKASHLPMQVNIANESG